MPAYSWLARAALDPDSIAPRMRALRLVGVPYTDEDIAGAAEAARGHTELDALVSYLQVLGTALKPAGAPADAPPASK